MQMFSPDEKIPGEPPQILPCSPQGHQRSIPDRGSEERRESTAPKDSTACDLPSSPNEETISSEMPRGEVPHSSGMGGGIGFGNSCSSLRLRAWDGAHTVCTKPYPSALDAQARRLPLDTQISSSGLEASSMDWRYFPPDRRGGASMPTLLLPLQERHWTYAAGMRDMSAHRCRHHRRSTEEASLESIQAEAKTADSAKQMESAWLALLAHENNDGHWVLHAFLWMTQVF